MENKRFDIFFDKHFGFGIRWDTNLYDLYLSISFPFFSIAIGLGKDKIDYSKIHSL